MVWITCPAGGKGSSVSDVPLEYSQQLHHLPLPSLPTSHSSSAPVHADTASGKVADHIKVRGLESKLSQANSDLSATKSQLQVLSFRVFLSVLLLHHHDLSLTLGISE